MDTVIEQVCGALGVEPNELADRGRHKRVVLARAMVVHVARQLTSLSYSEIACGLSRENHSSFVAAHQRLKRQIADGFVVKVGSPLDGLTYAELTIKALGSVRRASRRATPIVSAEQGSGNVEKGEV